MGKWIWELLRKVGRLVGRAPFLSVVIVVIVVIVLVIVRPEHIVPTNDIQMVKAASTSLTFLLCRTVGALDLSDMTMMMKAASSTLAFLLLARTVDGRRLEGALDLDMEGNLITPPSMNQESLIGMQFSNDPYY